MPSVEGVSVGASEVLGDSWYPDENTQAAASIPKDRFNGLLTRRLAELDGGTGERSEPGARRRRLMIVGGMLDDPGYLEVFESLGADIVADQLCCGTKTFSHQTDEDMDPGRMPMYLSFSQALLRELLLQKRMKRRDFSI